MLPPTSSPPFFWTLLWKNQLLLKKSPKKILFAIFFPVVVFGLLGFAKSSARTTFVADGWSGEEENEGGVSRNLFKTNYLATEATLSGVLLDVAVKSWQERTGGNTVPKAVQSLCAKAALAGNISTDLASPYSWPQPCRLHVVPWKFAIVPDNPYTRDYFSKIVGQWYPRVDLTREATLTVPAWEDMIVFFNDTATLEAYVESTEYAKSFDRPRIFAAIEFKSTPIQPGVPGALEYAIRMDSKDIVSTNDDAVKILKRSIDSSNYKTYATSGFMSLQTLMTRFAACTPNPHAPHDCRLAPKAVESVATDQLLLDQWHNDNRLQKAVERYRVAYNRNVDLAAMDPKSLRALLSPLYLLPQAIGKGMLFPFPVHAYVSAPFFSVIQVLLGFCILIAYMQLLSTVLENVVDEKETRTRELLKILGVPEIAIAGTWLTTFATLTFGSALVTGFVASHYVFENTTYVLLVAFFWLIGLAVVSMGLACSAVFSKSRTAIQFTTFLYFVSYIWTSNLGKVGSGSSAKAMACLFPAGAMNVGIQILAQAETNGIGITFANFSMGIDGFEFSSVLWMLLLTSLVYLGLAWYLEKVVPKEYGVPLPWYFPFQSCMWMFLGESKQNSSETEPLIKRKNLNKEVDNNAAVKLSIRNLWKEFRGEGGIVKTAVRGLTIDLREGEITCLLGHNGAGKTTLISMLTGLLEPSSGDALIYGFSLRTELDAIRKSLGMCPQHNILYPELTVEQHLQIYGKIKGICDEEALQQNVAEILKQVGLSDKKHCVTSQLSGGMKRKLSLAIAFLGSSKVVLLDEPTSGMDPYSRRQFWDLIQSLKSNRVIILTTHFMDEAEILGDRIAIMANGELRCFDTPSNLKKENNTGYNLTFDLSSVCAVDTLVAQVQAHFPTATVVSRGELQLVMRLPLETSAAFRALFCELDTNMKEFCIESYGISVTTMEQVFFKVTNMTEPTSYTPDCAPPSNVKFTPINTKTSLFGTQLMALMRKRFLVARRDKRLVLFGIVAPILLVYFGLQSVKSSSISDNIPPGFVLNPPSEGVQSARIASMCQADWLCNTIDGIPNGYNISASVPVYPTQSPKVFNVTYNDLDTSGTTGFCIRLGEELWKRSLHSELPTYSASVLLGTKQDGLFGYILALNTTSVHAAIVQKAWLDDATYRALGGQSLTVHDNPLPLAHEQVVENSFAKSFAAAILIVVAFAQYSAAIVPGLVKEKHPDQNAKHQQLVSGANFIAFWTANFLCDFAFYLIPASATVALIYVCHIEALTTAGAPHAFAAVVLLLVLFGAAMIPFCYLLTFLFTDAPSSQTNSVLICTIVGVVLTMVSFILDNISSASASNESLKFIWRLSPLYNLGNALFNLCMQSLVDQSSLFKMFGGEPVDAFSFNVAGYEMVYLGAEAVVFFALTVALDVVQNSQTLWKSHLQSSRTSNTGNNPPEVDKEAKLARELHRQRDVVSKTEIPMKGDRPETLVKTDVPVGLIADDDKVANVNTDSTYSVILEDVWKEYDGGVQAVKGVSLALRQGECFGYLGTNGAGKTTTMKMMTGDVAPTSGRGTLCDFDMVTQQKSIRQSIGYCPQFDALVDLLTVREHLELFASLKGIPRCDMDQVVEDKLEQLKLKEFENHLAKWLSGGTKRKLSVAIAMIGAPRIIFLDEPSTGMDPVSKRFMWKVISQVSTERQESTIVLTTHSMEECEALCSRVGIMSGGSLQCLGTTQFLKEVHGNGLIVQVKLLTQTENKIQGFMEKHSFLREIPSVTQSNIAYICDTLGSSLKEKLLTKVSSAGLSVKEFAHLWLTYEDVDKIQSSLATVGKVRFNELRQEHASFNIEGSEVTLANVFGHLESLKTEDRIQDYTVSQSTLEDVFNKFAADKSKGSS